VITILILTKEDDVVKKIDAIVSPDDLEITSGKGRKVKGDGSTILFSKVNNIKASDAG
jgi:hypothetical protein